MNFRGNKRIIKEKPNTKPCIINGVPRINTNPCIIDTNPSIVNVQKNLANTFQSIVKPEPRISNNIDVLKKYFNNDMNFYICGSGGCGSTILFKYLSLFGNAYHIHDRYPPNKLKYTGKENTDKDVYSEWFNDVEISEDNLKKYKVIFIYRNPVEIIFSRFGKTNPNIPHLQHIMCNNDGNIKFSDIINKKKDLYGIEEFFDNYTVSKERNYDIYAVKYELFWNNISLFNNVMGIPDIKELYPVKKETPKRYSYVTELNQIYKSLINKMNRMSFIEVIKPIKKDEDNKNT